MCIFSQSLHYSEQRGKERKKGRSMSLQARDSIQSSAALPSGRKERTFNLFTTECKEQGQVIEFCLMNKEGVLISL